MMARSPRANAAARISRIAVLLPVPVVPMSLEVFVLVLESEGYARERDAGALD